MQTYKVYDARHPYKKVSYIYANNVDYAAKKWGDEYYSCVVNLLGVVPLIIITPFGKKHKRLVSHEPTTIVNKKIRDLKWKV